MKPLRVHRKAALRWVGKRIGLRPEIGEHTGPLLAPEKRCRGQGKERRRWNSCGRLALYGCTGPVRCAASRARCLTVEPEWMQQQNEGMGDSFAQARATSASGPGPPSPQHARGPHSPGRAPGPASPRRGDAVARAWNRPRAAGPQVRVCISWHGACAPLVSLELKVPRWGPSTPASTWRDGVQTSASLHGAASPGCAMRAHDRAGRRIA